MRYLFTLLIFFFVTTILLSQENFKKGLNSIFIGCEEKVEFETLRDYFNSSLTSENVLITRGTFPFIGVNYVSLNRISLNVRTGYGFIKSPDGKLVNNNGTFNFERKCSDLFADLQVRYSFIPNGPNKIGIVGILGYNFFSESRNFDVNGLDESVNITFLEYGLGFYVRLYNNLNVSYSYSRLGKHNLNGLSLYFEIINFRKKN